MKLVKIPRINGLSKTKGVETSPDAILEHLEEIYSSEKGKPIQHNLLDIEEIKTLNNDIKEDEELIYEKAKKYFGTNNKFFFLGGDHSISFPLVRAFDQKFSNACLIVFDAHPDCMTPMDEPTHEEWVRAVVEKGFKPENILIVGVRNSYKDELFFMKKKGIKFMDCDALLLDIENACDTIMEFSSGKNLYLSIDIDVVDCAFAPATGYKNEVGGLTSRQLLYVLKRLVKVKGLRAVDLVEINSEMDKEYRMITTKLGAKILGEFL